MSTKTPKSISREEKYLDKMGGNDEVVVPKPISREEKYMYRAAGYDDQPIPDYPIGRNEKYWAKIVENGGGGGEKLIAKTIVENGQYNAADDDADGYSSVNVNVPNTYELSDEGKVVSNGNLVEQTEITVTENGTIDTTFNNSVIVDVPSGPAPAQKVSKGAVFRDYDGTIVYSYTKEQVAELSELPAGPTHDGLLFQKWNWSLSNIKSYVNKYDYVEVGATYITDDGKTRIYISLQEGRLFPMLGLGVNGSVDIDWGDGSAHDTMTGTSISSNQFKEHQYAQAGDYVITLDVMGEIGFNGRSGETGYILHKYGNASNVSEHEVYTNCITKIHLGSGITSIGACAFQNCYSLISITIPDEVTSINNSAFQNCFSLATIIIPGRITNIDIYTFNGCYSLALIIISDEVTHIYNYAFYNCFSLASIIISDGIASIGNSAFYNCFSLASITISDGVTNIGNQAFFKCYGVGFLKFESVKPPTVSSSNTFSYIPKDCIIMVPTGSLAAYTSATNYPSSSQYTYIEY